MISKSKHPLLSVISPPRRRFVQGLAAGSAILALPSFAQPSQDNALANAPEVLNGPEFDLTIDKSAVNFTGKMREAITVNGSLPGPVLRMREGSTVTIRVTNKLDEPSSIHWHGLLLPYEMDGVPGFSFPGIAPGETFTYRFKVRQSGTYWYHSHSRFQEQIGLYGAIVIEPANAERNPAQRDYTLLLSDWTDLDPEWIFRRLKQSADFFNYQQPTFFQLFEDISEIGLSRAIEKRKMWNQMRMSPTDLGDVSGAAFTYLSNGATPAANWTGIAAAGERVRLRVINAAATTIFDVRIPGLRMTVVSADGQDIHPVDVEEFRISVAETYDVLVQMPDDRAYTIFAQSIDRTGYSRATLAPRQGMSAAVPELDDKTWLSMADMGMGSMEGHDMSSMSSDGKSSAPQNQNHDMAPTQHAGHQSMQKHDMPPAKRGNPLPMQGHDMTVMEHGSQAPAGSMEGHDMSAMQGSAAQQGHDMSTMEGMEMLETGPGVDSRAMSPSKSLNDPGPRLRDNGRRVLTYADLRTVGGPIDNRPPGRDIVLRLTGNMNRFIWGFDGKKFSEAEPIVFQYGERLRMTLINDSMMNHPIHLHGMWSEIESEEGTFLVRKHTVNVQPGKQVSFQITADARGQWAFHCHLLYHMEAGMFRKVVVA